jgi:hypothetical protein
MFKGLGWIEGVASPHYNERADEFDKIVSEKFELAYGIENDAAMIFEDEKFVASMSSGGSVYALKGKNGKLEKEKM